MKKGLWVFPVVLMSLHSRPLTGQVVAPPDTGVVQPAAARPDSLGTGGTIPFKSVTAIGVDTVSPTYKPAKSAGLALLLSAVLPGAGQFYNQSYWKVPIVLGFGVYFASQWLDNNRRAEDYRVQYQKSIEENPPYGNTQLLNLREFYKNQRDTFTWYFLILYVLNIVDAYVDASLFDFNVNDNLSIRLLPDQGTKLKLRIGF